MVVDVHGPRGRPGGRRQVKAPYHLPDATRHSLSVSKATGVQGLSSTRTSCRASWQSPSSSIQCRQSERSYAGMSAGIGTMVITKVIAGVDVAGGRPVSAVGVGAGGAGGVGGGPACVSSDVSSKKSPHPSLARLRSTDLSSSVPSRAVARVSGPPTASMKHRNVSWSPGFSPRPAAVASHSSWFRQAAAVKYPDRKTAPALSSCPRSQVSSVINSLRSTHSSPVRRHVEVSWLRGPGSPINMATNTPKSASSPRQATIQASSSGTGTLASLSISCSLPGLAACFRHEISGFDSRDSAASE